MSFNKEFWDKTMTDDTNVIKGPWKDRGQSVEERKKISDDMSFIENLTETTMVQLIHTMNENDIDIKDDNLSREIGFINECIKSMLHRELGYPHPMTKFIQNIVVVSEDEEKTRYSHFDTQRLLEILDNIIEDLDE